MHIDPRYDALCANCLNWMVIIFAMLHQLSTWVLCLMQLSIWISNWSYKIDFSSCFNSIFNKSKAANSEIVE